jgi:hypothetical protein
VRIEFAQAAAAEAEPHRPQVPQLRLRKAFREGPFTGRTPASDRSGTR